MRAALLIAAKDLRLRARDRSVLVLGFVAPLGIAMVMSFAFQGAQDFHTTVVVVDQDRAELGTAIVGVLRSDDLADVLTVETAATPDAARALLDDGKADAGLVIPAGFTAGITQAEPPSLEVLATVDTPVAEQVVSSIAASFAAQLDAGRLAVATARDAGAPDDQVAELARAAAAVRLPVALADRPSGSRPLTAISYYAPAMAMFFAFFAIGFTARGWFGEQREGTLERTAAAVSVRQVLLGKALAVFVYGLASLGTVAVVTSVFFGADWGGPLPAAVLIVAMTVSVVCLTALVITLARTEQQAQGLSSILVFGLALLGGNFVLLSSAPEVLRHASLFTPNGWALRGFVDLSTGPHTLAVVWKPVGGILAFSAVAAAVAAVASRRLEVT